MKSIGPLIEELKHKIIAALSLEGVKPSDIQEDEPLFKTGLGLDSIDALELVALLEQEYGIIIQERSVAEKAFASVRSMAEFVSSQGNPCPDGTRS